MTKLMFDSELLSSFESENLQGAVSELEQLAFARSEKLGQFAMSWLEGLQDPLWRPVEATQLDREATPIYDAAKANYD